MAVGTKAGYYSFVFVGKGTEKQLEISRSILEHLNEGQWYGELDAGDNRVSISGLEDVEPASVAGMADLPERVTEGLGLDIGFELLANMDEDYGEHAILRIARSESARSVQEARYNVGDYGDDLEEAGSAAEADEDGFEAALWRCTSGEVASVPFGEYFEECDEDVVREDVVVLGSRLLHDLRGRRARRHHRDA